MNEPQCDYDIQVEAVSTYVEERSEPDNSQYFFAYQIVIRNTGSVPAQLLTRHWIITDGQGDVQQVKGEGVIGEQPRLAPGQVFQYTSAAVLKTPVGSMHGSYQMVTDDGIRFDADISPFSLAVPSRLN
ncbi:MAG: Co2+/Mg2+ efflux protein ApaG [Chromatiales bacterium]|nr:Co2+/Mg2+ efflux protein ApaG [Chromatiales bacterium]